MRNYTITDACNLAVSHAPLELRRHVREKFTDAWNILSISLEASGKTKKKLNGSLPEDVAFKFMRQHLPTVSALAAYESNMNTESIPDYDDDKDHDIHVGDIVWLEDNDNNRMVTSRL